MLLLGLKFEVISGLHTLCGSHSRNDHSPAQSITLYSLEVNYYQGRADLIAPFIHLLSTCKYHGKLLQQMQNKN